MRFIRKGGRIIPIHDRNEDQARAAATTAGVSGAAVAAGYHLHQEHKADLKESAVRNSRGVKSFQKRLKPGDILTAGSHAKGASGLSVGDAIDSLPEHMQKKAHKTARFFGLKRSSLLYSNATIIPLAGGGKKYHGGVYLGKGRVSHMTTNVGATTDSLENFMAQQNVSAFRFKNAGKAEKASAIEFAKTAAKKHVPYQNFKEYSKNAVSNYLFPFGKKVNRSYDPMVCHTLPIRAYAGREFSKLGEHTFAGEFRKAKGIEQVAKRNIVKAAGTSAKTYVAIIGRGLKWGAAAAGISYLAHKILKKKEGGNG